jgi:7,8-dihydroneopterin aldolase/epimerase/oxygenase
MAKAADQVFIKNLCLMLSVGIYPAEKEKPQRVLINAVFDVEYQAQPQSIQDVLSYENVIKDITAIAQSRHYDLLEVLGEDIIQALRSYKMIRKIVLSLEKPDIFKETEGVGITLIRVFPA